MNDDQKRAIKTANEARIIKLGLGVNDWLPILDTPALRPLNEIKARMSVMNALINIAFDAPTALIKQWLEKHQLISHLSASEVQIINTENAALTEDALIELNWYLESLWALMWATNMIDSLNVVQHVGDNQASLLPNLEKNESNQKIDKINSIQSETSLYAMLDYYYRLHWFCVNDRLNQGKQQKVNEGLIVERRKALEWIFNRSGDWDDVAMNT
ncbi:MAG: DUF4272 domain-containing protein [Methylophilaceae bacterium]